MFDASDIYNVNYNSKEKIIINQGGTSCFGGEQLVITQTGETEISKLKFGDNVLCYNETESINEFKPVINILSFVNQKPTVKIKLKSGKEIIVTEDHLFYFKGEWVAIKHLLSLLDGRNMANNSRI